MSLKSSQVPSAELVVAGRRGDQNALAELWRRAWPRALAAVRSSYGWDEAEDAVAEGFARALDRLDRLRDPEAVEAWMVRCAMRAWIDLARRRSRVEPSGTPAELPEGRFAHSASAAEGSLAALDRAAIGATVGNLPDDLRRLIRLRFVDGLSVQEVATVLGRPEGTVRRRCFDAYRLLQQGYLRRQLRPASGECAQVTDQLCRAAARRASLLGHRRIDSHLSRCPACRARHQALEARPWAS